MPSNYGTNTTVLGVALCRRGHFWETIDGRWGVEVVDRPRGLLRKGPQMAFRLGSLRFATLEAAVGHTQASGEIERAAFVEGGE